MTTASNGVGNHGQGSASAVTDQLMDVLSRGQQTMTDAASGWAELWGSALSAADEGSRRPAGGSFAGSLPSPVEVVDRFYDTGVAVLEMQRSFAHQVLETLRVR